MPLFELTAAEILAMSEGAAAAETAAGTAATVAAEEAAAQAAAQQAAQAAAQQGAQQGILAANAPGVATPEVSSQLTTNPSIYDSLVGNFDQSSQLANQSAANYPNTVLQASNTGETVIPQQGIINNPGVGNLVDQGGMTSQEALDYSKANPIPTQSITPPSGANPPLSSFPPGNPMLDTGGMPAPDTPTGTYTAPPSNEFLNGVKSVGSYIDSMHPLTKGAIGYGILSATGALRNQGAAPPQQRSFYNPYKFSPDFQGTHPNPSAYQYAPKYADGGMAMGGQPGQMYPMSQQEHTNFMDPTQLPASAMAVRNFEPATNPMTGNMTTPMASGGIAHYDLGGSISPLMDQLAAQDPNIARELAKQRGQRYNLASGGITDVPRFARGGTDIYDASLRFADIIDNPNRWEPPDTTFHSVRTFQDTNPNTANKLADEAAAARASSINKRSYVDTGAKYLPVSRRPGQLNLSPVGKEQSAYDNQESILAASGGIMGYNLGGYAKGDMPRLLRGPGDGVSDNIPATIAGRQPARLADGEFVIPARIVSELGNGSTDAGAKRLHQMMDDVQKARGKTVGKGKVAIDSKAYKKIPKA